MKSPITIFYVYAESDEDEVLRQRLEKHLALLLRQKVIAGWKPILAGAPWAEKTEQAFEEAELILLLVSADFLSSDVCYEQQMRRALERERQGEVKVIPILLQPVDWKGAPFAHLQVVPRNEKPITSWSNREEAFREVAEEIRSVIERMLFSKVHSSDEKEGDVALLSPNFSAQPNKLKWRGSVGVGIIVLVVSFLIVRTMFVSTSNTRFTRIPELHLSPVPTAQQTVKPNPAFANQLFQEVTSLPGRTLALSCPQKEGVYPLLAQTFATKICVANQTAQANFAIQAAFTLEKTNSGAIGLAQKYSDEKSPFAVFTLQSDDASKDGHCFYYNFVDFPSDTVDGFVENNRQNHREPSQTTCFFDGGKPVVLTEIVVGGLVYIYINGEYEFTTYDELSNVNGEIGAFILSLGAKNGASEGTGATKAGTVQDFKFWQFTVRSNKSIV